LANTYAIFFWLSKLIPRNYALFDLGGHVGTKYRAWREYLPLTDDFKWTVCDLPAIVEAGKKSASETPHLRFTSNLNEANKKPILLASGVLQYADFDLPSVLDSLPVKPTNLLINKVPSHKGPDVFTLEHLHYSVVQYRIFDEQKLLADFERSGYKLIDRWRVLESSVRVPFTELGRPKHFGYYLQNVAQSKR
jgi:putative methyltransferase (TIGR04325 family)